MGISKEGLVEAVKKAVIDNRLSCGKAHDLSTELNVPLRDIGAVCNELNIKISSCQLGCF